MTTLICDTETSGLLDAPNLRFHMLQLGDADGTDAVIYADLPPEQVEDVARRKLLMSPIRPLEEGLARLAAADCGVWHNFVGYDRWILDRFFPGRFDHSKMLDTLVLARLANPENKDNSLEAWGRRTGVYKSSYNGDYQTVDDDFLTYSEADVAAVRAVWHAVKHVLTWGESAALEMATANAINLQERNGFMLDLPAAQQLAGTLRGELEAMVAGLQEVFPPIERVEVKINKANNAPRGWVKGEARTERKLEAFNPNSRVHVAERLIIAGWNPTVRNDDGTWKCDEATLATLPYPEAQTLRAYFGVNKMLGQLSDGKEGWLRHVTPSGRVHGRVNPNGAVTGRMSHSKPNMANIDKDKRMRGCWVPRPGWTLVGTDAEGLEARMLAHFLARYDNGRYAGVVLEGSSKTRTDVHSSNIKAAIKVGLLPMVIWKDPELFAKVRNSGQGIKGLLYAMMYGGQDPKLGLMVVALLKDCGLPVPRTPRRELGALFRTAVGNSIVGFNPLTERVKEVAKAKKYIVGLDGRRIRVRSQHAALNSLLQGGGAIVMKKALCLFMERAALDKGWVHGVDFGLCANVHDEVQIECRPELAEAIGDAFETSIKVAGEHFKLRCPLAGKASIGRNWAETH